VLDDHFHQTEPISTLNGFHNYLRPIFSRVLQPPIVNLKHGRRVASDREKAHVLGFISDSQLATDNRTFEQMSFAGESSGGSIDGYFANDPHFQTTFFLYLTHGRLLRGFPRIDATTGKHPNRNIAAFDQQNILFFVVKNDGNCTISHEPNFRLIDNTLRRPWKRKPLEEQSRNADTKQIARGAHPT